MAPKLDTQEEDGLSAPRILEAARMQVRRFGEAKTNVVDIARALGTSHTSIYRHFKSKADVFDAIVLETMQDEQEMAAAFVARPEPASQRLYGLALALHRKKLERFDGDPEIYQLYRRVIIERPEIVSNYAKKMTRLIAVILADGVKQKEFKIDDVEAGAEVVRDALTVFIHPAHVEAAARSGVMLEPGLRRVLATLTTAFTKGVQLNTE